MKKLIEIIPMLVLVVLVVVFGLIACFANTQSIVSILLAGTLSTMYAVRLGGLENFFEFLERLWSYGDINLGRYCVIAVDVVCEIAMLVLEVISIIGLFGGWIEPSFINIFIPSWVVFMIILNCIGIIKVETEKNPEESEENY